MRRALALILATSLFVPTASVSAAPPAVGGVPVCVAEAAQRTPDISGRWIVWEDERWGYDDVWVHDLATGEEHRLSAADGKQALPTISGTRVVAEDYRNTVNSNLYQYDVVSGAESVISETGLVDRFTPDVYGDQLVWADERGGDYDVYLKDLATGAESKLVTDGYAQTDPAVGDKWVVWHDERKSAGSNGDIYGYKFATGFTQAICTDPAMQQYPDTSGNTVVWQDFRNDQWDIYAEDTLTGVETTVCVADGPQSNPAISGNWVVWQDGRNGDYDIYGYNLVTQEERELCTASGDQTAPAISGDWVVWQDERDGSSDIYAVSLIGQPDLSASAVSGPSAAGVGGDITVNATVSNHGDAPSTATALGVYLSADSTIDRNDVLIGTATTKALAVSESASVAAKCTLPSDSPAGGYYLGVIADSVGVLTEADEDDNAALGNAVALSLPSNDAFSAAALITGVRGTRTGQLTHGATKESGEPKHAGNPGGASVWYKWTAPSNGYMTFDLAGSTFDTVLGVYRGSSVGGLTLVTSNDDVGARLASRAKFAATKGVTYYFAVDGYGAETGTASITWTHQALSVTTPAAPSSIRAKSGFTASGYLKPRHAANTYAIALKCYRYESGKWILRKTVRAKISNYSSYSRYAVRMSLPSKGKWRIQAEHADSDHALTASGLRSVTAK